MTNTPAEYLHEFEDVDTGDELGDLNPDCSYQIDHTIVERDPTYANVIVFTHRVREVPSQ